MSKGFKEILGGFALALIVGLILLFLEYRTEWFKQNGTNPKTPETTPTNTTIALSEIPSIIRELVAISDANTLRAKLDEYNKRSILAIGGREDFENPEGFFVFVLGGARVYGTFLFHDNDFWDLRTNSRLTDLPEQLRDKQQIWVIEADKLVEH